MPKFIDPCGLHPYHLCDQKEQNGHRVMPRGFSEQEKEAIRRHLLDAGAAMLRTHSVSKISVEELARAAHISKGAFYQFFPSKESLFLMLFAETELAFRDELRKLAQRPGRTPKARLLAFLRDALRSYREMPLFSRLSGEDVSAVMRQVSPAQMHDALNAGAPFFDEVFAIWRKSGLKVRATPMDFAVLMQSIVLIDLHGESLGASREAVIDFILEAVVEKLTW
jgi:AcrR family transcriptional regulator